MTPVQERVSDGVVLDTPDETDQLQLALRKFYE